MVNVGASTKFIDEINALIEAGQKVSKKLRSQAEEFGFNRAVQVIDAHNAGKKVAPIEKATKDTAKIPAKKESVAEAKTSPETIESLRNIRKKEGDASLWDTIKKRQGLDTPAETVVPKTEEQKLNTLKSSVKEATSKPVEPKVVATPSPVSANKSKTAELDAQIENVQNQIADAGEDESLLKQLNKQLKGLESRRKSAGAQTPAEPVATPAPKEAPKLVKRLAEKSEDFSPKDSVTLPNDKTMTLSKSPDGVSFTRVQSDYATFNKQTGFEAEMDKGLYNVKFLKEDGTKLPPEQVVELKKGILEAKKEGSGGLASYAKKLAAGGILLGVGSKFLSQPTPQEPEKSPVTPEVPPAPAPEVKPEPAPAPAPAPIPAPGTKPAPAPEAKGPKLGVQNPQDLDNFFATVKEKITPMSRLSEAEQTRFSAKESELTQAIKDAKEIYASSVQQARSDAERRENVLAFARIGEMIGQALVKYLAAREGKRLGQRISSDLKFEKYDWNADLDRSMEKLKTDLASAKEQFGIVQKEVETGQEQLAKERTGLEDRKYKEAQTYLKAALDEREQQTRQAARERMDEKDRAFQATQNAAKMGQALKIANTRIEAEQKKLEGTERKQADAIAQAEASAYTAFTSLYNAKGTNKKNQERAKFMKEAKALELTGPEIDEINRLAERPGWFNTEENMLQAQAILQQARIRRLGSFGAALEAVTPAQQEDPEYQEFLELQAKAKGK